MKLTIEDLRGVWRAQIDHRTQFADTLEELLLELAPDVPGEYVWHAAEVLGAVLGAEIVEPPPYVPDPGFADWFTSALQELEGDEASQAREVPGDESWQPTDAQRAYFEPENIDEYPRGV